jgi:3-oxoacyl-[acyl-carrier protein] reductase
MATSTLKGRTALVTGGTRGIGAAIAARLQAEGADVVITGRNAVETRPGIQYRAADFVDRPALEAFARRLRDEKVDILVNNAGINVIAPFERIDVADFDRIQSVNVRAPFLLCQAVVPWMSKQGWGRIVNIGSVFGIVSKEQRAAYSASKFALDGLTTALAAEVASSGVLANCVSPGFIETDLTLRVLGAEGMAEMTAKVPMKRLGKPEEVAALVAWLAGPDNTFISGQNIVIDGGFCRV